jgi:hypothetical protein
MKIKGIKLSQSLLIRIRYLILKKNNLELISDITICRQIANFETKLLLLFFKE